MSSEVELTLEGASSPAGEIRLADLAALAQSLQELSLRIGRAFVDAEGPGRTPRAIEDLSQLRLRGIDKGSTRLTLARGPAGALDLELAESAALDRRFWEVIEAVGKDERPGWVTDLVADSAASFVEAVQSAAPTVEVIMSRYEPVRIRTQEIHPETWMREGPTADQETVVVTGRLEAVDLRSGRFRVVDDVAHRIGLDDVPEAEAVAHLINHRVRVVGSGIVGRDGQLKAVRQPTIIQESLPSSWFHRERADLTAELAKPGPTFGEGVELTDEEYAEFVAFLKG